MVIMCQTLVISHLMTSLIWPWKPESLMEISDDPYSGFIERLFQVHKGEKRNRKSSQAEVQVNSEMEEGAIKPSA